MPLNERASKVLADMKQRYGDKKGEQIFYATANKKKLTPETWAKEAGFGLPLVPTLSRGGPGAVGGAVLGGLGGSAIGALINVLRNNSRARRDRTSTWRAIGDGVLTGALPGMLSGGLLGYVAAPKPAAYGDGL